jgi:dolichol-phosphate mannosyltransferase
MDRVVVNQINNLPEKDRFIRGLRAWVGYRQIGVGYIRPERYWGEGVSTTNFWKGIQWARRAIFSFSFAPLEWVFYASMLSVFISLFGMFFYLVMYFTFPEAPRGFITTLLAVLFIGSVQLVVLSLLSEYIRRIFEEVKGRPEAIVKEVINNHKRK